MASLMRTQDREAALTTLSGFADDEDMASVAYYHIGEINMMLQNFDEGFTAIKKSIEFSNSIYDVKLRVMGYVDFQYNAKLAEKMKLHGIDLFNQQPDDTNRALE